jgi:hypothetical protein
MAKGHKLELEQQLKLVESFKTENDKLKALKPPMPVPVRKQPDSE